MLRHHNLPSPFGRLRLTAEDGALTALDWIAAEEPEEISDDPLLQEAEAQIAAYFARRLNVFDLPLRPAGTPHQQRVWRAMREIPYGHRVTYGALAAEVKSIARAVGSACGANPIPVVIPCHRVVARQGLGGFSARGGVGTKRRLLALESARTGSAVHQEPPEQASLF